MEQPELCGCPTYSHTRFPLSSFSLHQNLPRILENGTDFIQMIDVEGRARAIGLTIYYGDIQLGKVGKPVHGEVEEADLFRAGLSWTPSRVRWGAQIRNGGY